MRKAKKPPKIDAEKKKKRRISGIFSIAAAAGSGGSKSLSTLREKAEKPLIGAAPIAAEKKEEPNESRSISKREEKRKEKKRNAERESRVGEKSDDAGDASISEPLPLDRVFASSVPSSSGEGGFGWLDKLGVPKSERYRAFVHDRSQAEASQGIVKVAILGQVGAGKTSICKRFCEHGHVVRTEPTICFELHQKMMKWRSCTFNLNLYDMAGSADLGNAATGFGRIAAEADCLVLVHDLSDASEGAQLNYFMNEDVKSIVRNARASGVPVILVFSKYDLIEEGLEANSTESVFVGSSGAIARFAEDYRETFGAEKIAVTSARKNVGIDELFSEAAKLSLIRQVTHKMCLCKACSRSYVAARDGDLGPYLENKRILEAFGRGKRRTARSRGSVSESVTEGSEKSSSSPSSPSKPFSRTSPSFGEKEEGEDGDGTEVMDFCDYLVKWTGCGCGRGDSETSD